MKRILEKTEISRLWGFVSWLPIGIFFVAIGALCRLDIRTVMENHVLLTFLNLICSSLPAFLVVYLAARSFFLTGDLALSFMGTGMLVWGLTTVLVGPFGNDTNALLTIHNSGVFLAGFFCLASAVLYSTFPSDKREGFHFTGLVSIFVYMTGVLSVMLLTWAVTRHSLPLFLTRGGATTHLRQLVLGAVVAQFALAAIIFRLIFVRERHAFFHWYSLGLILFTIGLLGVWLTVPGTPLNWAARAAQFLAGPYFIIAALALKRGGGDWRIALRESEKSLRLAFERLALAQRSAGAGIWDWDMATGKLNWTTELFQIFGLNPLEREASFDVWRNVVHPEDVRLAQERIDQAIRGHAPLNSEYRVIYPTGKVRWINSLGNVVYGENGQAVSMLGICLDITDRKLAEEAVRQSEERYRNLFNGLIEGFCLIEVIFDSRNKPVDYRFLEINDAFEEQAGLHNAKGKLMRDLAPDHEAYWFDIYGKVALTGERTRFMNEAKTLNRWFDVCAFKVGGEGSRKVAICFSDITKRKRDEIMLRKNEEELKKLNRTLKALSDSNQAMMRSENEAVYLGEVCRIIVQDCGGSTSASGTKSQLASSI